MTKGSLPQATYNARLDVTTTVSPHMAHDMRTSGEQDFLLLLSDRAAVTKEWRSQLIGRTALYENVVRALVFQGEGQDWALTEQEASGLYDACNALERAEVVYGAAVAALVNLGDVVHPLVAQAASSVGTIHHHLDAVNRTASTFAKVIAEAAHLARTLEFHAGMVAEARDRWHEAHGRCWREFLWVVGGYRDDGY